MPLPVNIISTFTLELWNQDAPWVTGIGGSETSHIEMHQRFKKRGYVVNSFAPSKSGLSDTWKSIDEFEISNDRGIFIFYRAPEYFAFRPKNRKQSWWFIAQDVDYEGRWTPEGLANVDRYICLCKDHASFTEQKYPSLKGRIYISSNGIRSDYIRGLRTDSKRDRNTLFFPSSPDRGVKFLLENWFRVKEINPKAVLNVAYGMNNMDKIIELAKGEDWRSSYKREVEALMKQKDVNWLGRLNQKQIYEQWQKTNIWAHPTDFPETSCITCMEAQALGAWPVTNDLWALRDNVKFGYMVSGVPQSNELVRSNWLHSLEKAFHNNDKKTRKEMQDWALENHDWENVVTQWAKWIEEDSK